jgi:cobalt-zinc-cadmium efflux system outer membrane protein
MQSRRSVVIGVLVIGVIGCAPVPRMPAPAAPLVTLSGQKPVAQVAHFESTPELSRPDPLAAGPTEFGTWSPPAGAAPPAVVGLADMIALSLERNPRLAHVNWAVEAARGRALQAGLYPNPTVSITGEELGDRTGPGGIWTAPLVSQEIVTGNKLGLSRAAALKEVDQATLNLVAERYRVLTEVRQAFFEVVILQARSEILRELVKLADQSVENAEKLLRAKETAPLDVVQLEVDRDRYRAELEATERSIPPAFRRLAASVGAPDLASSRLAADLDRMPPDYDLDRVQAYVVAIHPELRSAQVGVERAQLLVQRAEADPIPNLTVSTGYTRQNQNKSNDWTVGVGLPVPVWNRNEGNILAAKAQLGEAVATVGQTQNHLVNRIAGSFGAYTAARRRAERYKADIVPKTRETYDLALKAYRGGQFEYLRVLQAQRAVAEANLEYLRSLGEMWRAASEVAGFMLEDQWPLLSDPPPEKKQP